VTICSPTSLPALAIGHHFAAFTLLATLAADGAAPGLDAVDANHPSHRCGI